MSNCIGHAVTRLFWVITMLVVAGSSLIVLNETVLADEPPPLTVAVLLSSDKNRCYDPGVVQAIRALTEEAVERHNREAAPGTPRLLLRFFDDFEAPEATIDNVRKALADPRLIGLIGLSSSSRAKAVIDALGADIKSANVPFVSDVSLDSLFADLPSVFSMATTVRNEVDVVKRFIKDRGFARPMFVGLQGDDYSDALGDGLAVPPNEIALIADRRLVPQGNALDQGEIAELVAAMKQAPPDVLLLAVQSGPGAQLMRAMVAAGLDIPVFILYGRAKRILDLLGDQKPTSELLELGRDGVPNVTNERLRKRIWADRETSWIFDDTPNKSATGWQDGGCKLTVNAAPLKLLDERNRRAIGRGAQYGDVVTLIGAALDGFATSAPIADLRSAVLARLANLSTGTEVHRGLWQDWSFSAGRVVNDNPIILQRPRGGGPLLLAPVQYQRAGANLLSTPVLYLSLDPVSIQRIDTNDQSFEAEFYLSLRTSQSDLDITDIEFTNASRSTSNQMRLVAWHEIHNGIESTRFPAGTKVYKVSGKFAFEPELEDYPFDTQRLLISFQPVTATRPFVIQPVDPAETGARAEIDSWDIKENYVGTDQDVIPTLDAASGAKTIVTFYKFNQTFVVKRQAVDFYLRVLIPLVFILLVTWFSVFLDPDRFDSIMAIQVTALLSAIALYLALPQIDSAAATLSDRTFVATYAAVSVMIGLSVLQDSRMSRDNPLVGRIVFGFQAVIFPLLLAGVFGWLLAAGR